MGLAAIIVLFAAGCSNGKNTGSSGSTDTPPAASPAANPAIASLVPSTIKSKGTLTIALDASDPPWESVASDGHTITGIDPDLVKALAQALGLKAQLINVPFATIIPGLADGRYDVGMSSFTDTQAREKIVNFVTYYQVGESFYVRAGSAKNYNGLDSLCGAKVSVQNGTLQQTLVQNQAKKCISEGKPTVTVLSFGSENDANLAVSSGRVNVGFADSFTTSYMIEHSNGQFTETGKVFDLAPYGIALPKGNGMAPAVLAAMKELMKNGTYMKILTKWRVQSGAITNPVINGATS